MKRNQLQTADSAAATEARATLKTSPAAEENRSPFTPTQLAGRWHWHPESVRRAARARRIASILIGRRRLIPASEVERIEREGFIARAV